MWKHDCKTAVRPGGVGPFNGVDRDVLARIEVVPALSTSYAHWLPCDLLATYPWKHLLSYDYKNYSTTIQLIPQQASCQAMHPRSSTFHLRHPS